MRCAAYHAWDDAHLQETRLGVDVSGGVDHVVGHHHVQHLVGRLLATNRSRRKWHLDVTSLEQIFTPDGRHSEKLVM